MRRLACALALAAAPARPGPVTAEPFRDVAGFFPTGRPWLGFAVELVHLEVFVETGETRRLAGVRGGSPVDASVPVSAAVQIRLTPWLGLFAEGKVRRDRSRPAPRG